MIQRLSLVALGLLVAVCAQAQTAEIGISAGWSAFSDGSIGQTSSFDQPAQDFTLDNGLRIGARISFNRWFLGQEISYAFQSTTLNQGAQEFGGDGGMSIQNYYYNFVIHATPQGTAIRPFATAGGGVSTFFPPGSGVLSGGGENKFGYNYGGGLKFKLNEKFGLRFDVRDHVTGRPFDLPNNDGLLHNVEYSTTFSLLF